MTSQDAAKRIAAIKNRQTPKQQVQDWQTLRHQQQLSGEFALAAALGVQGYDEEQIHMIAHLFGR